MNLKAQVFTAFALTMVITAVTPARAADLLMVRSAQAFPETMNTLQSSINAHGYNVSRVQRVDVGLTKSGYKTDKYRVVFFGKPDETRRITKRHPDFVPYLPLKMAIFAEEDQTLVVTSNPERFADYYPDLAVQLGRWANDMESILDDVRQATGSISGTTQEGQ